MYLPTVPWQELRSLPIEDLALRILRNQVTAPDASRATAYVSVLGGLQMALNDDPQPDGEKLLDRVSDAWAWLEAHGLLGRSVGEPNSSSQRVTAAGHAAIESDAGRAQVLADRRLSGALHVVLEPARAIYALGAYDAAVHSAMKAVEVAVRDAGDQPAGQIGVRLVRSAFDPKSGSLADTEAELSEREAISNLFAGAIGAFKNPASHRNVEFEDPAEAAEVLQLANLLLRLVDRAKARSGGDAQ